MAGQLWIVPTPIGNLGDVTQRSIAVLKGVDGIAAEDDRITYKLLHHLGLKKAVCSFHKDNEHRVAPVILKRLLQGENWALVSDAGTPLIQDPGLPLVQQAAEQGIKVTPLPGACAITTALSASGLPSTPFHFVGYFPVQLSDKKKLLSSIKHCLRLGGLTLIAYESPHRLSNTLSELAQVIPQIPLVLAKELTKKWETFYRGSATELLSALKTGEMVAVGEWVLMAYFTKAKEKIGFRPDDLGHQEKLNIFYPLCKAIGLKPAAQLMTKAFPEISRKLWYQMGLSRASCQAT